MTFLLGGCAPQSTEQITEPIEPQTVTPADQTPLEPEGSPETVEPSHSPPIPSQPPPAPITELVGPPRVEGLVEPKPEYEALDYCVQYFPEGLRLLTDAEKESVIELALEEYQKGPQDPTIQERLKGKDIDNYTVSKIKWYGIEWSDLERTEIQNRREYPYWVAETGVLNCIPPEDLEFGYYVLPSLSEEAVFYPRVSIAVGESFISLEVVVDLDKGIILSKWLYVPHR
jgi:hypothetical protein